MTHATTKRTGFAMRRKTAESEKNVHSLSGRR